MMMAARLRRENTRDPGYFPKFSFDRTEFASKTLFQSKKFRLPGPPPLANDETQYLTGSKSSL